MKQATVWRSSVLCGCSAECSESIDSNSATGFEWLRGVDLNHRPLGYECYCSRNLMDLRGAKSNVMSSLVSHRNRNCPFIALVTHSLTTADVTDNLQVIS